MNEKQKIGKQGEDLATEYLKRQNYKIMARNFRSKRGEIDIIAKDQANEDIVIVEVKTRRTLAFGMPAEAVNKEKRRHLYLAANYYIYINKLWNKNIRFDVIEIFLKNETYQINHIKNIDI